MVGSRAQSRSGHGRRRQRRAACLAFGVVVVLTGGGQQAQAGHGFEVTGVSGEAYGYFSEISLFGGPPDSRGPDPRVGLPPAGSDVPLTATDPAASATYGPATFFSSGMLTASTQGAKGFNGAVTSSTDIQSVNTSGQEVFTAANVSNRCTASGSDVSGSTTVQGGTLQTSEGNPSVEGDETVVPVPRNPAPNTVYEGTIESVGDSFRYVFNEQVVNADGSITVNAAHQYLLGPTAVGELIIGRSTCGVTATPVTDHTAPETTITRKTIKHRKRTAKFRFKSSEAGSTFRCRLDKKRFRRCSSPKLYRRLKPGRHSFRVAAIDAAANRDPSPAIARWRIKK